MRFVLLHRIAHRISSAWRPYATDHMLKQRLRGTPVPQVPFVLIFGHEALLPPHYDALLSVGKILSDSQHSVAVALCRAMFHRCPSQSGNVNPLIATQELRQETCHLCKNKSLEMDWTPSVPRLDLIEYLDTHSRAKVESLLKQAYENPLSFVYDNIQFGKLALFEPVITLKVCNLDKLSELVRKEWLENIHSLLTVYFTLQAVFERHSIKAITYMNDYPFNLVARILSDRRKIPVTTLTQPAHQGIDRTRLAISHKFIAQYNLDLLGSWPARKDVALTANLVREITEDIFLRFSAKGIFNYSPAKSLKGTEQLHRLGLSNKVPTVVAYSSSIDEYLSSYFLCEAMGISRSGNHNPFPDQLQWLSTLANWTRKQKDIQLVIRIHPRESRNRREQVISEHLGKLRETLFDSERIRIVWPEDPVSSYSLAEIASVALTSWSTIGLELARMGIPVIAAFCNVSYFPVGEFIFYEHNEKSYFDLLQSLLMRPRTSLTTITAAYRWYHLYNLANCISLKEESQNTFNKSQLGKRIASLILERANPQEEVTFDLLRKDIDALRIEERASITFSMRRLIHYFESEVDPGWDTSCFSVLTENDSPLVKRLKKILSTPDDTFIFDDGRLPRSLGGEPA